MSENTEQGVVLCGASSYEEKFYLNQQFERLPEQIRQELQIMCVLFTADVGGVLTLRFDELGHLEFDVSTREDDFFFDEIGSELKMKELRREKQELLEALELYYRVVILKEDMSELLDED